MSMPEMDPIILSTEREGITLRQLTIDDARPYFDAVDANREHLSQFGNQTAANYQTVEDVERSILEPENPDKLRFGIWDGDTFTGSINLTPKDDDSVEVGYWLDARFTGNGYATTAAKAVTGFAQSRHNRVYAEVVDGNEAYRKVLERAGMQETARALGRITFELPRHASTDELAGFLEDEPVHVDYLKEFADDFIQKGLNGLAMNTPEGVAQFKEMYSEMWDRVSFALLYNDAEWQSQAQPEAQLLGLFNMIWDLRDDEELGSIAKTAFILAFKDNETDGLWGEIFGNTTYYGKNELLRAVESMCRDGSFSAGKGHGPEHLATVLTNIVYATYATLEMMPSEELSNKDKWLAMIKGNLKR